MLFEDGANIPVGNLMVKAIHTPGHTPACLSYLVQDESESVAFVGDTLFMPEFGTARCDFPGGDARLLFRSIRKILAFPPQTLIFTCHDYPSAGNSFRCQSTVTEQAQRNIHAHIGISEDEFVAMREARDSTLGMPKLILPSVQINVRGGRLPEAEDNGIHYLKIPINRI